MERDVYNRHEHVVEYKEMFIAAIDRQIAAWANYQTEDAMEALQARVELERFLTIKREMAEMEAEGIKYEVWTDGINYGVRPI